MKKSKFNKLIQKPLRFHHQDIHEEIEGLTDILVAISNRLIRVESLLDAMNANIRNDSEMARITEEQILSTIGELWLVEVRESERGWGSENWNEYYTTFGEAQARFMEINKDDPTDHVPDYYIIASKPRVAKIHFD